jgi:hypothetical protein
VDSSVGVFLLRLVGVGLGATVLMDLWNLFLERAFGVPSLNFCLLGRWIQHMPSGTFRHSSIALAEPKPFECTVGWSAHYLIGMTMGATFVLLAGDWVAAPTVFPAFAFGVGTVVMPFFLLQPALGLGVASSRVKNPAAARLKSLATHSAFGVGLYLSAQAISYALRLAA